DADIREMLKEIGVSSIEELFESIPKEIRIKQPSNFPPPASEQEALGELSMLAEQNMPLDGDISFLGGGPMRMYRPAVLGTILSRSEFITAYTPYQAEMSQGVLQAIYEYQTMVSELLGMDLANASSYDGGTAAADAIIIAKDNFRGKRNTILVAENIHPEIRQVMKTYNFGLEMNWVDIPEKTDGRTDLEALHSLLNEDVAAVFLSSPTRHGVIEDLSENGLVQAVEWVHEIKAIAIAITNVIACAALKPPGDLGFDIAVAEGQPLGLPVSYGGPYLGIFAVKEHLMRKIPGRLSGMTVDVDGRRGFTLTLQAREQHIRRERATSNICSNHALCALAAAVYVAYYGKIGLPKLSRKIIGLTQYAKKGISEKTKFEIVHKGVPHFNEFAVRCPVSAEEVNEALMEEGIQGGLPLGQWDEDPNTMLLGFSDENTKDQIDSLIESLSLI
ncbi:MAG: aminomethyl-transferring glycine dehydrogenase subunit GcvPA, partial [bacterium]